MGEEYRHNESRAEFEVWVDGRMAGYIDYELAGDVISFEHTVVYPDFGGRGLGGLLVRYAVEESRQQGWKVVPHCPFARAWLAKHPQYDDVVVG